MTLRERLEAYVEALRACAARNAEEMASYADSADGGDDDDLSQYWWFRGVWTARLQAADALEAVLKEATECPPVKDGA